MARRPRKPDPASLRRADQSRSRRSSIRRSTDQDFATIRRWLEDEDARGLPGNFLCNIEVIERAHDEGELLVFIHGKSGEAVAFQLGGLIRPGILAVRHELRRQGIGRKLAERCIVLAKRRNQPLLYITCEPPTSIPFWQAMGFTILPDRGRRSVGAYRVLEQRLSQPADGQPVDVDIAFYPSSKRWNDSIEPYVIRRSSACRTADGVIHLDRRIAFHEAVVEGHDDLVVEVTLDSQRLYMDKAKYEESASLGVIRCTNGYYIDRIDPAYLQHSL